MLIIVIDKTKLKVYCHKCNNNKIISILTALLNKQKKKEFYATSWTNSFVLRKERRTFHREVKVFSTRRLPNTVASPSVLRPRNFTKAKATWKLERNKESVFRDPPEERGTEGSPGKGEKDDKKEAMRRDEKTRNVRFSSWKNDFLVILSKPFR